jgi:diaminohydroxyphosphoribosylaminopyrimidine deaminase / 5-amino-6-(5-phosphoribosylamino)uracil reductase
MHAAFMERAIALARKGGKQVQGNPNVGCVIVQGEKIVGEGYHKKYGGPHAEISALTHAEGNTGGATMYVSLEPCSHHGKTGPCTQAISAAGIKKVIIAVRDPHHRARGGKEELEKNGIAVEIGLLETEARALNRDFFKLVETGMPWITLKMAMTADEFISWGDGKGKRITGKKANEIVQELRSVYQSILVGSTTVQKDNPRLTCRGPHGQNPLRIVIDSQLDFPLNAKMITEKGKTIVYCTPEVEGEKTKRLEESGVLVIPVKEKYRRVDLVSVLKDLGSREIKSVLVEGGAEIAASFMKEQLIDECIFFISPKKVVTGLKAFGKEHEKIMSSLVLKNSYATRVGKDIMITGIVAI